MRITQDFFCCIIDGLIPPVKGSVVYHIYKSKRSENQNNNKIENSPRKQAKKEAHAMYNTTTAFCIKKLIKVHQ